MHTENKQGFTLIELSIVLVIIGLIVGGVLAGKSLINAAAIRAQISQIEKYNSAANTFYTKYGYLPGDIPATPAAQFGFTPRGSLEAEGDGNGLIEGLNAYNAPVMTAEGGEAAMFWVDLTTANGQNVNLIEGGFNTASPISCPLGGTYTSVDVYVPQAKIGYGNYVYVWGSNGGNYFALTDIVISGGNPIITANLPVTIAYNIDNKIDDGFPQTGNVTAQYPYHSSGATVALRWAAAGSNNGASDKSATSGSTTTCFDNSSAASGTAGVSGATQHYSLEINNGNGANCALSFHLQAGD